MRGSARQRGYDRRWERMRAVFLGVNPYCAVCLRMGKLTVATVVDHIIPHRGDQDRFWDEDNWQALCETHHNSKTMGEVNERRGFAVKPRGCNADGMPTDPAHPWNV